MNAMYQAPVDAENARIFADVAPKRRINRRTPRPVSLRFSAANSRLFMSVRDRYGSFARSDLVANLHRCVNEHVQIEQKTIGAGLGLYLVTVEASALIVNVLPDEVTEFICILDGIGERQERGRELISVTVQRRDVSYRASS